MGNNTVRMKILVPLGIVWVVFFSGCTSRAIQSPSDRTAPPAAPNPTPLITAISPNSGVAGGAGFTLTVNGANFVTASVVNFGGTQETTTFISATQLTASIPASSLSIPGDAAVTVLNPSTSGGLSNTVNFAITGTDSLPIITSVSPSCFTQGEPGFTLFVSGTNFLADSVVRWNNSDRPTTLTASGQLSVEVSASDTAVAGTAAVTVFNPGANGGSSGAFTVNIFSGGIGPQAVALDPTGKFAYTANTGCFDGFAGQVSMYAIDPVTGTLASIAPPVAASDEGTRSIAVDPSGKFVYAVSWGGGDTAGSLAAYSIDATTGALTPIQTIDGRCPGLCAPWSVAVDPSDKFVFVANEGGPAPTGVSIFSIDSTTGTLTLAGIAGSVGRTTSVAVAPSGKFVYVANGANGFPGQNDKISTYAIDGTTGQLTATGIIDAGSDPSSVAVDPTGTYVYVTNTESNDVSMYTIDSTSGALSSTGTIAAGTAPVSVAVDPTGKFAYVANSDSNDVSMYTINTTTGALSLAGTIAAGGSPSSIAIHPSGKFAYVTNSGSNDISIYSLDSSSGALSLIGTIGS